MRQRVRLGPLASPAWSWLVPGALALGIAAWVMARAAAAEEPTPDQVRTKCLQQQYDAVAAGLTDLRCKVLCTGEDARQLQEHLPQVKAIELLVKAPDRMRARLLTETGAEAEMGVRERRAMEFGLAQRALGRQPLGPKLSYWQAGLALPDNRAREPQVSRGKDTIVYSFLVPDPRRRAAAATCALVFDPDWRLKETRTQYPGASEVILRFRAVDGTHVVPDLLQMVNLKQNADYARTETRLRYTQVDKYWLLADARRVGIAADGKETELGKWEFQDYAVNTGLKEQDLELPLPPRVPLDLSTPEQAIKSLYVATAAGDLLSVAACLTAQHQEEFLKKLRGLAPDLDAAGPTAPLGPADMWRGFFVENCGTVKGIEFTQKQEGDILKIHAKGDTTGRPIDRDFQLVKEADGWHVAESADEVFKDYD